MHIKRVDAVLREWSLFPYHMLWRVRLTTLQLLLLELAGALHNKAQYCVTATPHNQAPPVLSVILQVSAKRPSLFPHVQTRKETLAGNKEPARSHARSIWSFMCFTVLSFKQCQYWFDFVCSPLRLKNRVLPLFSFLFLEWSMFDHLV